jgi:hypothetical protein
MQRDVLHRVHVRVSTGVMPGRMAGGGRRKGLGAYADAHRNMLRFCLLILLSLSFLLPARAGVDTLRVMPPAELAQNATIIARARVIDVDESDWGDFRQVAELELVDVIQGDFTLREVQVAARSMVAYTDDRYKKKEEYLVFLSHEAGLYRTVNYQYGQFKIENEIVRGWRSADNVATDRPYYSVREEVERILTDNRTPASLEPVPGAPAGPPPPQGAAAAKPAPGTQRKPPRVIRTDNP